MNKNSSDKDVLDAYERSVKQQAQSNGGTSAGLAFAIIALVLLLVLLLVVGGFLFRSQHAESSALALQTGVDSQSKERAVAPRADSNGATGVAADEDHHEHPHFEAEGALVTNHGIPLFQETQTAGGVSPAQRAQIVAQRLNDRAVNNGLEPTKIQARLIRNVASVCFVELSGKTYNLATVDPQTAAQFGYPANPARLTLWWRDVLRDHACVIAGKPPIYTTPYSSALQNVYSLCQRQQKGIPTHEEFEKAIASLSRADRNDLQGLYVQVPSNYRPQEK